MISRYSELVISGGENYGLIFIDKQIKEEPNDKETRSPYTRRKTNSEGRSYC